MEAWRLKMEAWRGRRLASPDEEQAPDTDPHRSEKLDLDPDPHLSEKLDPETHLSDADPKPWRKKGQKASCSGHSAVKKQQAGETQNGEMSGNTRTSGEPLTPSSRSLQRKEIRKNARACRVATLLHQR
jgi:hypothetical protein